VTVRPVPQRHWRSYDTEPCQPHRGALQLPMWASGLCTTEVRQVGFYWVILGQNPPEIPSPGSPRR
jgi:hypothetical protein